MRNRTDFIELKPVRNAAKAFGSGRLPSAARLPQFIGSRLDAPKVLGATKAAIVGLGSVGGPTALHLTRLGVAELWLVDPKAFKRESLLTHSHAGPSDVGKSKALRTARLCQAINPAMRLLVFGGKVEDLPLDAFADVDLVIMATDNLAAEIEVGQRCLHLAKPLIQASVHGESLVAQVRCFGNDPAKSACPACGFTNQEWELLRRQTRFSCEGYHDAQSAASSKESAAGNQQVTMSTSGLCALGASLASTHFLRLVLRLGAPVTDTEIEFCAFTNRATTSPLKRREDCPCDHRPYTLSPVPKPLGQTSFARLFKHASLNPEGFRGNHDGSRSNGSPKLILSVPGHEWAESGTCRCAAPAAIRRFLPIEPQHGGRCAKCHAPIVVQPFSRSSGVTAAALGTALNLPLRKLGAADARCVLADDGYRAVLFRHRPPQTTPHNHER